MRSTTCEQETIKWLQLWESGRQWDENDLHLKKLEPRPPHKTPATTQTRTNSSSRCQNTQSQTYHHVRVIDDRINVICGLDQGKTPMPQRNDTSIHPNACKDGSHHPQINGKRHFILCHQCSDQEVLCGILTGLLAGANELTGHQSV